VISLAVRKIDPSRIMIEGDQDSLLFLSESIKEHALGKSKTCEADVPLKTNLVEHELGDNEFGLFLHRLPCDEEKDLLQGYQIDLKKLRFFRQFMATSCLKFQLKSYEQENN